MQKAATFELPIAKYVRVSACGWAASRAGANQYTQKNPKCKRNRCHKSHMQFVSSGFFLYPKIKHKSIVLVPICVQIILQFQMCHAVDRRNSLWNHWEYFFARRSNATAVLWPTSCGNNAMTIWIMKLLLLHFTIHSRTHRARSGAIALPNSFQLMCRRFAFRNFNLIIVSYRCDSFSVYLSVSAT